mmetsp:Transcript_12391/g.19060  ORF Transcript_12391/g.19060 Transcript_12391/m.19060 type:complete len:239 (-) Transcript_12391:88-804(-)|eukprot:CAMPEP_0178918134 /NCGR_PEP_ID=MMETSP0786-20121207/13653_1 /TAXON_ID=186022 /ORGANISM="Thalassionema frauenfeldii, Strain CCMP 1798" /LENGTH=238 /DNA_ID=CAMNT_0020591801 /DNA_START=96 /DNA_END=812 /DNA_ORIENTATION=-
MQSSNFDVLSKVKDPEKLRSRCDNYVEKGLTSNPTVKFLIQRLISMGCIPPKDFIRCKECTKEAGGGFGVVEETVLVESKEAKKRASLEQCQRSLEDLRNQIQDEKDGKSKLTIKPEIYLCQQHIQSEDHAHTSMVHELIHAVDMCRAKMDPLNNCIHMACTEIRAQNLSGECAPWKEFIGGQIKNFPNHGKTCVKRRALLSVKENPNCRDRANDYVEAAFERCYKDTFPFDRHPSVR